MNENQIQLTKTARIAGLWYLLLAVSGILGFMVFHSRIYLPADPEKTLKNLIDSEYLARTRLILEMIIVLSQTFAALWFYKLFKSISDWQAWAIGIWGTINSILILLSAISMASAIQIASSSVQTYDDKMILINLLGNLIKHSWGIGGLFFGLWLIPMGHIIVVSKRMPLWLGWVLIAGGVGYILNTLIRYIGFDQPMLDILTIPATIGEFWMIGYLLLYGIRPVTPPEELMET